MTDCGRVKEEDRCHHNVHIHIDFYPARTDLQMYRGIKVHKHACIHGHTCMQEARKVKGRDTQYEAQIINPRRACAGGLR